MSIMFQYEGDDDYTWDKTYGDGYEYDDNWNVIGYSDEKDDAYYTYCPMLGSGNNVDELPGYAPSPADFCINDYDYDNYAIDLSAKLAGKKVVGMIILPSALSVNQDGWNDEKQVFNYTYYYDYYWGTMVGEISLFN